MKDYEDYHRLGYEMVTFEDSTILAKLNEMLVGLCLGDGAPPGFHWESKYASTFDLRPDASVLDESLLSILVENNIHEKLLRLTNQKLTLLGINLRKGVPHPTDAAYSYMPWHRDSYQIDGKRVGLFPPSHKLIYYPQIEEPKASMQLLQSSHRCQMMDQKSSSQIMPGVFQFDKLLFDALPLVTYDSSINQALMFNTSLLHNAVPDRDHNSIRAIWNFCSEQHLNDYYSHGNHFEISDRYEKLIKDAS